MSTVLLRLCLALTLGLGGAAASRAATEAEAPPAAPAAPAAAAAPRQILVMLRLAPPHFRPDAYQPADYREGAGQAARRRLAAELARSHGLTMLEDWAMPDLGVDCYLMAEPDDAPPGAIVDALERDGRVEWAQAVKLFSAQGGADPLFPVQPGARDWPLSEVRKVATGRGVAVAVIDSGVAADHPDLAGQISVRGNFVDGQADVAEDHGTAVAGVIAARAGNGIGIEGVAPQARLMALRACWQTPAATLCNSFTLGKALNFALRNGAQVINLSLSGPPDRLLRQLVELALARGVLVVGAVDPARADGGFPASHPGVFAVSSRAAVAPGERLLLAPGTDIPTTAPGGRWGFVSGSSYSAAHISGMMALLSELRPALTVAQMHAALVFHGADQAHGGAVDLCATITKMTGACRCGCFSAMAARRAGSP